MAIERRRGDMMKSGTRMLMGQYNPLENAGLTHTETHLRTYAHTYTYIHPHTHTHSHTRTHLHLHTPLPEKGAHVLILNMDV